MPAQTVMQVRRDTAANWSSTNPVLANGEMGYDTTNAIFKVGNGSTAWNSLAVLAQPNIGSAARPLLRDGAYLSGSGLVLSGLSGNYASAPDSAALSITGDIDIKVKVALADWTGADNQSLVAKRQSAGQRSFMLQVDTAGTLSLLTSADGTSEVTGTSTVATGVTDGATKWVRATLDVNNGAGSRVYKFYTSDNGTTWTQLGTTVTTAGTTSIFDGTSIVEVGSTAGGTGRFVVGTVYDVVIQSAYDTADNTTSLQFDANFETQTADALAFTESSSNTATVTINTTRYTVGLPGTGFLNTSIGGMSANVDYWHPFIVTRAIVVDMMQFEVTTATAGTTTMVGAVYAADDNFNPTGNKLIDFGSISVGTTNNTVYRKQVTGVTLQPGNYVLGINHNNSSTAFRLLRTFAPILLAMGSSPLMRVLFNSRTHATFPDPAPVPTGFTAGAVGFDAHALLRWKAA